MCDVWRAMADQSFLSNDPNIFTQKVYPHPHSPSVHVRETGGHFLIAIYVSICLLIFALNNPCDVGHHERRGDIKSNNLRILMLVFWLKLSSHLLSICWALKTQPHSVNLAWPSSPHIVVKRDTVVMQSFAQDSINTTRKKQSLSLNLSFLDGTPLFLPL